MSSVTGAVSRSLKPSAILRKIIPKKQAKSTTSDNKSFYLPNDLVLPSDDAIELLGSPLTATITTSLAPHSTKKGLKHKLKTVFRRGVRIVRNCWKKAVGYLWIILVLTALPLVLVGGLILLVCGIVGLSIRYQHHRNSRY